MRIKLWPKGNYANTRKYASDSAFAGERITDPIYADVILQNTSGEYTWFQLDNCSNPIYNQWWVAKWVIDFEEVTTPVIPDTDSIVKALVENTDFQNLLFEAVVEAVRRLDLTIPTLEEDLVEFAVTQADMWTVFLSRVPEDIQARIRYHQAAIERLEKLGETE